MNLNTKRHKEVTTNIDYMRKQNIFIFTLISLLLFSCKKEDNYQVDARLDPYLQLFLQEAEQRGFHFDVEENGLLLQFADLKKPTIGLCTYSDPLLVQIDRTYWKEVTQYNNCEDLRQDVVFHELGHGLLNRKHDNSTLSNTEWKSIMCGGETVRDRSWQVNFSGKRKKYYLDELFNIKTPEPSFTKYGAKFSGEKGELIAAYNFSKEKYLTDADGNIYNVSDNMYKITTNSDYNNIVYLHTKGNFTSDFYYEIKVKTDLIGNGDCVGIIASYPLSDTTSAGNYFYISKNNTYKDFRACAGHMQCLPPIAEVILQNDVCNLSNSTETTLAIERTNDELYFYVNDQLIYRNDYMADQTYINFGVVTPAKNTVAITSSKCYDKSNRTLKSETGNTLSSEFAKFDGKLSIHPSNTIK